MTIRRIKRSVVVSIVMLLAVTVFPMAMPAAAASDRANIYLVAIDDNGQSGQAIGCGDSLVPVTVNVGNQATTEAMIKSSLTKLFAIHDQYYGGSGLYDSLYQSNLTVDSVDLSGSKAIVHLSGSFSLGGTCDNPRAINQIESTITQFQNVDSAEVFYQGQLLENFLSGKGTETDVRYFPETGHSVGHGFLRYWEAFGGLPTFGYPITDEFQENGVTVQYFQRARFEWHPGAWPSHFDVLLGLLGSKLAQQQGLLNTAPFQRVSNAQNANCTYFDATGHGVCSRFRDYWESHGGLTVLGYPISQEFQQNGVTVQYFERQRLEFHPANSPQWQVEGGLLGTEIYQKMHP